MDSSYFSPEPDWFTQLSGEQMELCQSHAGIVSWGPPRSRPKGGMRWAKYFPGKTLGRKMGDRGFERRILDLSAVLRRFLESEALPEEGEVSQKLPLEDPVAHSPWPGAAVGSVTSVC